MCNHYRSSPEWRQKTDEFSQLKLPLNLPPPHQRPNWRVQADVYPRRYGEIVRVVNGALEPAEAYWQFIPPWHHGTLKEFKLSTNNCRSENFNVGGKHSMFDDAFHHRRCLIPADAFYEWTGPKGTKTELEITQADGLPFFGAGLWQESETAAGPVTSYTLLIREPGPQVAAIHDREPIWLEPGQLEAWLNPSSPIEPFQTPTRDGRWKIEPADPAT